MIALNCKSLNLESILDKKTGVNVHEFPCWPSWSELGGKDGQALLMGHQHIKSNAANLMTRKLWSL